MNTKIIPYSTKGFRKPKRIILTPNMIIALKAAMKKQNAGENYGPNDIKGSFCALIERGLIVRKEIFTGGKGQLRWQATSAAIQLLEESST